MVGQSGPPSGIDPRVHRTGLTGLHPVRHQVEQRGTARRGRRAGPPFSTTIRATASPSSQGPPFQRGGEEAAWNRLRAFARRVDDYDDTRDLPAVDGTSQLSADLRFGVLAPSAVAEYIGTSTKGRASFVRQLAWRDWYAHLLWELPSLVDTALRPELDDVAWENDPNDIMAWQEGAHRLSPGRCRHAPARDHRLDAQPRPHGRRLVPRQGSSGRLADRRAVVPAAPGRCGHRPERRQLAMGGRYRSRCRSVLPRLQSRSPIEEVRSGRGRTSGRSYPSWPHLPAPWVHAPWTAPPMELAASGVTLGASYPYPIIDHGFARDRVISAYNLAQGNGPARPR